MNAPGGLREWRDLSSSQAWYTELIADSLSQPIRYLAMAWDRGQPAVGRIDPQRVVCALALERTAVPAEVAEKSASLQRTTTVS